jgi:hypothetical protein
LFPAAFVLFRFSFTYLHSYLSDVPSSLVLLFFVAHEALFRFFGDLQTELWATFIYLCINVVSILAAFVGSMTNALARGVGTAPPLKAAAVTAAAAGTSAGADSDGEDSSAPFELSDSSDSTEESSPLPEADGRRQRPQADAGDGLRERKSRRKGRAGKRW